MIGGVVFGSLLPDIDNARSSISYKFPVLRMLVGTGQAVVRGIATLLPGKLGRNVKSMAGYRGLFHSPALALLLSGILALVGTNLHSMTVKGLAIGLLAGMASHIVLDLFSGGVPLGMPFITKRVVLARIKTGGAVEWILRYATLSTSIYCAGLWMIHKI